MPERTRHPSHCPVPTPPGIAALRRSLAPRRHSDAFLSPHRSLPEGWTLLSKLQLLQLLQFRPHYASPDAL